MEYQVLGEFNIHASSTIYIYIIYSHTPIASVLMMICDGDADDDIDTLVIIELQQLSLYCMLYIFNLSKNNLDIIKQEHEWA